MTARRWSEVKAKAKDRQPWLGSAEAERTQIRTENLGRICGHELAESAVTGDPGRIRG